MKRLDISQLLELCRELDVDNEQVLSQTLYATLEQLAMAAADKLGVAACGVEHSRYGVLASFAPRAAGDPCPALLDAFDDEGEWQAPPRRTLLVCDDDHNQTRLARRAVASLGVTVIETHTAEEAWQAYQTNRVNLVITDSVLPGQDGFDLMRNIVSLESSRGNRRKVPVITISGDAGTQAENRTGSQIDGPAGDVVHLRKPINWVRLGPVIGELCHAL